MAQKVTIGGNRLGSGHKNTTELHNYERSSFNLDENFISSMAPGVLVPFYCQPALNGDTFDINLEAMARTIPTQGPLFGSFKLQLDMFQVPIRLYQSVLHNNPINIGMKMAEVKMPTLSVVHNFNESNFYKTGSDSQIANNSLLKYLGFSGIGHPVWQYGETVRKERKINAIPVLAYYDIFKNYYANKQEENAYVITGKKKEVYGRIDKITMYSEEGKEIFKVTENFSSEVFKIQKGYYIVITGEALTVSNIEITKPGTTEWTSLENAKEDGYLNRLIVRDSTIGGHHVAASGNSVMFSAQDDEDNWQLRIRLSDEKGDKTDIEMKKFPLENIDYMRQSLLGHTINDGEYNINQEWTQYMGEDSYPYKTLYDYGEEETNNPNTYQMNGLVVKTYQSDIFNNWVQTDWITGDNGIAAITAVSTTSGSFTIDSLNLASKVYNMLNRIAISGGTYEDWQEAVFGEDALRHAESPIYCGGMSSEIVFEEVTSTSATADDALGTLAGKGHLAGKKGGNITIKVKEPSFIMGIVSITPRLTYSQGNAWYLTDLMSMDDVHKPALDGIGFQNLMTEQMAWWTTTLSPAGVMRTTVGKVPAWINYQTSFDKAFGDFAAGGTAEWMVLGRRYERDIDNQTTTDITTYIDPTKYNYAFADSNLYAQNFWVQIGSHVIKRSKMSSKIIPNL